MDLGKASIDYRREKDYFGVDIDLLKSQMQKCIRTGRKNQAIHACASMLNMIQLFPGSTRALCIQTNCINRIMISALEDVSVANPDLVILVLQTLLPMTRKGKRQPVDAGKAFACLTLLCESQKARICSWLHRAYHPGMRKLALEKGLDAHDIDVETVELSDPNLFGYLHQPQVQAIVFQRCEATCTWFKDAYRSLSEKRPILAFVLAIEHYGLSPGLPPTLPDLPESLLSKLKLHLYQHEILDAAEDIHTKVGRSMKRDKSHFVKTASAVTNQHPAFDDKLLYDIYLSD